MKLFLFLFACALSFLPASAQTVTERLKTAFQKFEADPQLRNALAALYVVDAKSGTVVFERNAHTGLAPASTQKIVTAATAYALLGKNFRYSTEFGVEMGKDGYQLFIHPSGDPTFGSWRWEATKEAGVLKRIAAAVRSSGAKNIGPVIIYNKGWEEQTIPDGWIWQDIGNYYGAGLDFDTLLN